VDILAPNGVGGASVTALGSAQNRRRPDPGLCGTNNIDKERGQAELRFWVGCGVERNSDAAEWSAAIVEFALTSLNLDRVYALQLGRHPLAGRVLAGIGMQREGLVRKPVFKGGLMEDVVCWAILSSDWQRRIKVNAKE